MEILEIFSTDHETQSDYQLTSQQAKEQMRFFRNVFTVVRLLKGEDLEGIRESTEDASFCECYDYWGKGQPCENCISMQTLQDRQQHTKLEFLGTDIYQVFSRYVEVDGKPCVMELIRKLDSDSLIGASERDKLIRQLSQYHVELYRDALTGAYNRRYLEDRSKQKKFTGGAAMIDLDDFKVYNDTCGHDAGDMVLETVVKVIRESSDSNDVLIRYGGDEFVLLSANADEQEFYRKLHHIRHKIHNAPVPGYSGIHLSVSIGGVYCENTLLDEAMHRADVLMYQAKNKKNAVIISEADSVADKESKQEILIVDDSEMNRAILAEMLGDSYIIHEAVNGEEALHDIGKIGIDEKILNKPGRLTKEEFEIMKTHTVIGANMLESLAIYQSEPLVRVAHDICRWHHERFDGKGYPDGLVGDEIPISAQVVSLADVYDALVSERVYKKAFSHERAIQMILNGECGAFNPVLLECLLEIQDTLKRELVEQSKNAYEYAAL